MTHHGAIQHCLAIPDCYGVLVLHSCMQTCLSDPLHGTQVNAQHSSLKAYDTLSLGSC